MRHAEDGEVDRSAPWVYEAVAPDWVSELAREIPDHRRLRGIELDPDDQYYPSEDDFDDDEPSPPEDGYVPFGAPRDALRRPSGGRAVPGDDAFGPRRRGGADRPMDIGMPAWADGAAFSARADDAAYAARRDDHDSLYRPDRDPADELAPRRRRRTTGEPGPADRSSRDGDAPARPGPAPATGWPGPAAGYDQRAVSPPSRYDDRPATGRARVPQPRPADSSPRGGRPEGNRPGGDRWDDDRRSADGRSRGGERNPWVDDAWDRAARAADTPWGRSVPEQDDDLDGPDHGSLYGQQGPRAGTVLDGEVLDGEVLRSEILDGEVVWGEARGGLREDPRDFPRDGGREDDARRWADDERPLSRDRRRRDDPPRRDDRRGFDEPPQAVGRASFPAARPVDTEPPRDRPSAEAAPSAPSAARPAGERPAAPQGRASSGSAVADPAAPRVISSTPPPSTPRVLSRSTPPAAPKVISRSTPPPAPRVISAGPPAATPKAVTPLGPQPAVPNVTPSVAIPTSSAPPSASGTYGRAAAEPEPSRQDPVGDWSEPDEDGGAQIIALRPRRSGAPGSSPGATAAVGTAAVGTAAVGTAAVGTAAVGTAAVGTAAVGTAAVETAAVAPAAGATAGAQAPADATTGTDPDRPVGTDVALTGDCRADVARDALRDTIDPTDLLPTALTPGPEPTEAAPVPETPSEPAAEEALAAIRWRLDGATLREVVDDRDDLRALGARLDQPLSESADNLSRARLLCLRAEVFRLLDELGMAAAASRLALAHAETAGDAQAVVVAQAELAHVLRLRGDHAEADRLFEQAASAEVPELLRSVVHENAGRSCFDQGRLMEALDHFTRAIRLGDPADLDLVERVDVALEAVHIRVIRDGFGPYPRLRREILAGADAREMPLSASPTGTADVALPAERPQQEERVQQAATAVQVPQQVQRVPEAALTDPAARG
jgi:hypothetical protein